MPFGAAATFIFGQEKFSRHFGVRRNRIVQCETSGSCQNTENKERREDTEETGASGQHGDDLIGARHATENEKEREKERDWQQDDQNLWDLGSVKFQDAAESEVQVEEARNAVTDIEDQPDRYITRNFLQAYLYCIIGFISIWFIFDISDSISTFLDQHVGFGRVLEYYGTQIPQILAILLPVSRWRCFLFSGECRARTKLSRC